MSIKRPEHVEIDTEPPAMMLSCAGFTVVGDSARLYVGIPITTLGNITEFTARVNFLGGRELRFTHMGDSLGERHFEANDITQGFLEAPKRTVPSFLLDGPEDPNAHIGPPEE